MGNRNVIIGFVSLRYKILGDFNFIRKEISYEKNTRVGR